MGLGMTGIGLSKESRTVSIDKEVAVVFDKKTGKIKYQDYSK